MGSKTKGESAAAREQRLADTSGPTLYAALKPVAERLRASPVYQHRAERAHLHDTIALVVTMAEAKAIVEAMGAADKYGEVS